MPRPLIIKIESHKSQPKAKATGSIDVQLLKGVKMGKMYEAYNAETVTDNTPSIVNDEQVNPSEECGSKSIVRSLISRYETSTDKANLTKYKSKSMVDLVKPQITTATEKTQDDFLYNRGRYNKNEPENQKFDFQKVFSKFETSSHSEQKRTIVQQSATHVKKYTVPNYNTDKLDLGSIKQKARVLLEQHQQRVAEYSSWQDQVVELLQQIVNLGGVTKSAEASRELRSTYLSKSEKNISPVTYKEESTFQRTKSLDHGQLSKNLKVRDIKNIFETKIDNSKRFSRSASYATYFGLPPENGTNFNKLGYSYQGLSATPFNDDYNNNKMESETSEDGEFSEEDFYDVDSANREITSYAIEGKRIITQPVLASSNKIQELKNLFESDSDQYVPYESYIQNDQPEETDRSVNLFNDSEAEDIHVVENRMLPPPKMVVLNDQADGNVNVEISKQRIEELTKDIEDYEQQIANLSEKDKDESSYLNEVLIRMLIKLDGIKTYGDAVIMAERKRTIQFVQHCITKLREKIKGTE